MERNRLKQRRWRALNPERDRENQRRWVVNNPDKVRAACARNDARPERKRRQLELQRLRAHKLNARLRESGFYSRPEQLQRKREWRARNVEKCREYARRANRQPYRKLKLKMLARIYYALKSQGLRKTKRMIELVGCSTRELKTWIESQFTTGMTWDLVHSGAIHIDHRQPCCSFDLSIPEQLHSAFRFTNLQPLWATENLRKAASDRKLSIQ